MLRIFMTFLGLGLTAFGGPVAHIGYFETAFVRRRARSMAGSTSTLQAPPG